MIWIALSRLALPRVLAGMLAGALACAGGAALADPAPSSVPVIATSVPIDPRNPEATIVGGLEYRGGVALRSPDSRFGGFSGLHITTDGAHLIAISDRGHWLRARLVHDATGRLAGLREAEMGPLIAPGGKRLTGREGDAEGLAVLPDGSALVSFERRHRILHYPASARPFARLPVRYPEPVGLAGAPANGGIEALTHVGRRFLLAFSEKLRAGRATAGWIGRDGSWARLSWTRTGGFRPTDAALLPRGDVLVLERRYRSVTGAEIRLLRVARRDIAPRRTIAGRPILHLARPLTVDNFEGVAARRGEPGETLIYLISDDNFSPLQRTLLLLFAMPGG